jgi:hypothetical protein
MHRDRTIAAKRSTPSTNHIVTTHMTGRPIRVDMQFAVAMAAHVGFAAVLKRHTPYALSIKMIGIRANEAGGKNTALLSHKPEPSTSHALASV